jgi:hypothetical protein
VRESAASPLGVGGPRMVVLVFRRASLSVAALLLFPMMAGADPLALVQAQASDPVNWAKDGAFEGLESVGFDTFFRADPTDAAALSGETSIEFLDVGAANAGRPYGIAVSYMTPGMRLADLRSVSFSILYPAQTSLWGIQTNHYIAFDSDYDGRSDACISARMQGVSPSPEWQTMTWDPTSIYAVDRWTNCHFDGEQEFPEWDGGADRPLSEIQATHPDLKVRSVSIQVTGGTNVNAPGPDPAYVDDLQVLAPLPALSAHIAPRNAVRTDGITVVEADSRNKHVFDIELFDAEGLPVAFTNWRAEVYSSTAATPGGLLYSVGTCGAPDEAAAPNDGDNDLTVSLPANRLLAAGPTPLPPLAYFVFWSCRAEVMAPEPYSELANGFLAAGDHPSAHTAGATASAIRFVTRNGSPVEPDDLTQMGMVLGLLADAIGDVLLVAGPVIEEAHGVVETVEDTIPV